MATETPTQKDKERDIRADNYPVPDELFGKFMKAKSDCEHDFYEQNGPAGSEEILLRLIFQLEGRVSKLECKT